MSEDIDISLSVSVKELPLIHVAYIEFQADIEQSKMHEEIGECFRRVQAQLRERLGKSGFI